MRLINEKRSIGSFRISALFVVVVVQRNFPSLRGIGFHYPGDMHALFRIFCLFELANSVLALAMKSQRDISFRVVKMFFFSFPSEEERMPSCQRAIVFGNISTLRKKVRALNFYKDLSSLLRIRVFNKSYMANIQGGMSFPLFNNPWAAL